MNLDALNLEDLLELRNRAVPFSMTIEKPVDRERLAAFEDLLKHAVPCRLVLVVDLGKTAQNKLFRNIDVLPILRSLKYLCILSNSSEQLENIDTVSSITDLIEFKLGGYYNQKTSIKPLEKFKNLCSIELELGLSKLQSRFVNSLSSLQELTTRSIDLKDFSKNEKLLPDLFPNLRDLRFIICKEIADLNFINELKYFESLTINYNSSLSCFTLLDRIKNRKEIELLSCRNIGNIDNIVFHKDLEYLSITDADLLDAVDFEKISALKQLNVVYTRFRSLQKNNLFDSLAEKNSWINKHAGMVKEIPFNLLVPDKNL